MTSSIQTPRASAARESRVSTSVPSAISLAWRAKSSASSSSAAVASAAAESASGGSVARDRDKASPARSSICRTRPLSKLHNFSRASPTRAKAACNARSASCCASRTCRMSSARRASF